MSLIIRMLLLAAVGWLLYRAYLRWATGHQRRGGPQQALPTVVRCEGCGALLPAETLSATQRCGACEQRGR